jgi:hypothetical protein
MDRRAFMKVFTAVVAAAVLPVVENPVLAAPTIDPTKKYRDCLEIVDRCRAETTLTGYGARFDELCRYVRANFAAPDPSQRLSNAAAIKGVMYGQFDENDIRQVPPVVLDEVYMIALAKLLLFHYKVPLDQIDSKHCTEFDWFYDTYGSIIFSTMEG